MKNVYCVSLEYNRKDNTFRKPINFQAKSIYLYFEFQVFSLSSSVIGMLAQPLLYKEIVSTGSVPMIVAAYSFVGLFTFVTPLLLHLITKKYVTSLEYYAAEDKYIAYTINFFCIPKKVSCSFKFPVKVFEIC